MKRQWGPLSWRQSYQCNFLFMVCFFFSLPKHLPDQILSVLFLQYYLLFLIKNNIVTFNEISQEGVKKEWKEEKEEERKEE